MSPVALGRGRSGMRRTLSAVINGRIDEDLYGHLQSNNSSDLGGLKRYRTE